jgi:hypothetical protein
MSLATHRAALVAMLESVADVGVVNAFERFARLESEFRKFYVWDQPSGDAHIRGWQISNKAIERRTLGLGRTLDKFTWHIRGYLSWNDGYESEIVFDDLVERIRAAHLADPSLGGVCTAEMWGDGPDGMQKSEAGPVMFCGALCHSAVLQVETWEYAQ